MSRHRSLRYAAKVLEQNAPERYKVVGTKRAALAIYLGFAVSGWVSAFFVHFIVYKLRGH